MRLFVALDGLRCPECADLLERRLERVEGVRWARVHPPTRTLAVDGDAGEAVEEAVRDAVRSVGGRWAAARRDRNGAERAAVACLEERERGLFLRLLAAGVLSALVWTAEWFNLSPFFLVLLFGALAVGCAWPLLGAPAHALRHRRADADLWAALGIWATLACAVWAAGRLTGGERVTIFVRWGTLSVGFYLLARFLDARSARQEAHAEERLTRGLPTTARTGEGKELRKPVRELVAEESVLVEPGELIPVDGVVDAGASDVDESALLGEGAVVAKSAGCRVLAGSLNLTGNLRVRAGRWEEASFLGGLVEAIRDGRSARANPLPLADRVAAWAAPLTFLAAAGGAVAWALQGDGASALRAFLRVPAFAGGPALLLAERLAAAAAGRNAGVRFLRRDAPDRAADLEVVLLGKESLLSVPKPRMTELHAAEGADAREVLGLALVAAGVRRHPYADAIQRWVKEREPDLAPAAARGCDYYPGRGLRAVTDQGEVWVGSPAWLKSKGLDGGEGLEGSSLWVAREGKVLGALEFSEGLRHSSKPALDLLRQDGLEVVLASGDAEGRLRKTARALDVQSFHHGLSPRDKLNLVSAVQSRGKRVAAVGRGLLEAPILAQSDLGIAVGESPGADIRLEGADPGELPRALRRAAAARRGARLCAAAILVPQAAVGVLAASGVLPPFAYLWALSGLPLAAAAAVAAGRAA